jgi:hypothetical protein
MNIDEREAAARVVLERFARAIIAKDYPAAHACFAEWLKRQVSEERLQRAIEKQLGEISEAAELDRIIYPEDFSIDGNSCSLETIREDRSQLYGIEPVCAVSPEMTEANFRRWMVITFLPAEDAEIDVDAWMDFWTAVVEVDDEYRLGYFEIHDPD